MTHDLRLNGRVYGHPAEVIPTGRTTFRLLTDGLLLIIKDEMTCIVDMNTVPEDSPVRRAMNRWLATPGREL